MGDTCLALPSVLRGVMTEEQGEVVCRVLRVVVNQVLQTRYLGIGPQIDAFEQGLASYTSTAHAIGVNSGTGGLHLAVIAANVGEGGLVITTPVVVNIPIRNPSRLCF